MIGALGILRSPVTKYVAFALAVMLAVAWIREDAASQARSVAEAKCQETFTSRVETEVARQVSVAETILEEAQARAETSEQEVAELQEKADALLAELQGKGMADSCLLDDDTIRRLREIR